MNDVKPINFFHEWHQRVQTSEAWVLKKSLRTRTGYVPGTGTRWVPSGYVPECTQTYQNVPKCISKQKKWVLCGFVFRYFLSTFRVKNFVVLVIVFKSVKNHKFIFYFKPQVALTLPLISSNSSNLTHDRTQENTYTFQALTSTFMILKNYDIFLEYNFNLW